MFLYAVTRILTHPLDTIKTRIQNTPYQIPKVDTSTSHSKSSTSLQILRRALKSPPSLYSGLGVSLLFSVPALGIYLSSYDAVKHIMEQFLLKPGSYSSLYSPSASSSLSKSQSQNKTAFNSNASDIGSIWTLVGIHAAAAIVAESLSGVFW